MVERQHLQPREVNFNNSRYVYNVHVIVIDVHAIIHVNLIYTVHVLASGHCACVHIQTVHIRRSGSTLGE